MSTKTSMIIIKRPATAPASTLTYRFQYHHLSHKIPYPTSTPPPTPPLAIPTARLPELVTSKLKVSDDIVHRRLLQSKTWRDWRDEQVPDVEVDANTDEEGVVKRQPESGLSPWTQAALEARQELVRTTVMREEEAAEDEISERPSLAHLKKEPRPVDADMIMSRTYLGKDNVASYPPMPHTWKIETRSTDMEILRVERNVRVERRRQREEERKRREEEEAAVRERMERERLEVEAEGERKREREREREQEKERVRFNLEEQSFDQVEVVKKGASDRSLPDSSNTTQNTDPQQDAVNPAGTQPSSSESLYEPNSVEPDNETTQAADLSEVERDGADLVPSDETGVDAGTEQAEEVQNSSTIPDEPGTIPDEAALFENAEEVGESMGSLVTDSQDNVHVEQNGTAEAIQGEAPEQEVESVRTGSAKSGKSLESEDDEEEFEIHRGDDSEEEEEV